SSVRAGTPTPRDENQDGNSVTLIGCGRAGSDIDIKITGSNPQISAGNGVIGEICVKSTASAKGYWKKIPETDATFYQTVDGQSDYFLTGDLGFLHDGELFVTGRKKEVIIINGVNYYPQDIELSAQKTHEAFAHSKAAAFCLETSGKERLILVIEGS